jgi:hypothetical protein
MRKRLSRGSKLSPLALLEQRKRSCFSFVRGKTPKILELDTARKYTLLKNVRIISIGPSYFLNGFPL